MEKDKISLFSFTCPTCYRVLQDISNNCYQCPKGHVYSLEELISNQDQVIENHLGVVYQMMRQRAQMLKILIQQQPAINSKVEKQVADAKVIAGIIHKLLRRYKSAVSS